jgi:hypothetical protein
MSSREAGLSLTEAVAVAAVIGLGLALALPALADLRGAALTAAGARRLAVTLQSLRWKSVAAASAHGLLFGRDAAGWYWHEVRDGNGNGLRAAEVRSGTDATLSGPHRLETLTAPARLGFPPGGPVAAIPPASGVLDPGDPIRFGASDLVAFSPLGTSSSGSLFVTDGRSRLYAVVLFGRTGRITVRRFDVARARWVS